MSLKVNAAVSESERHLRDVTSLVFHAGNLFSGADDGKVKVWTEDLKLVAEFQAHPVNVYSLVIGDGSLYSSSNDGSVQAWAYNDKWVRGNMLVLNPEVEVLRLLFHNGRLYSGDDKGDVKVWEKEKQVGTYNLGEEIWDLAVYDNILFTARYLYITITEMMPGRTSQFTSRGVIDGRSPVQTFNDKICFLDRSGRNICIHKASKESKFIHLAEIKGHDMIVNTLCAVDTPQPTIYSGGYDNTVKQWDVETQKCIATLNLDGCINTIVQGHNGDIYTAFSNGHIIRVNAK